MEIINQILSQPQIYPQIAIVLSLALAVTLILRQYFLPSNPPKDNQLQNDSDRISTESLKPTDNQLQSDSYGTSPESLKPTHNPEFSQQTDEITNESQHTQTDEIPPIRAKSSKDEEKRESDSFDQRNILNLVENLGQVKNVIYSDSLTTDEEKIYLLKKHANSFLNFQEIETRLNLAEMMFHVADSAFNKVSVENISLKEKITELRDKVDELAKENKSLTLNNRKLSLENEVLESRKVFPACSVVETRHETVETELEIRCLNYLQELRRSEARNAQLQQFGRL